MHVEIRAHPFDPLAELARYRSEWSPGATHLGALTLFVGTVRDHNEGQAVEQMTLEHYPGMTERQLWRIVESARRRWNFDDALVIHRVGDLLPADPIVLVAVWSSHRGTAFEACRAILEGLKHHAPFWKKETLPDGTRWVAPNTDGLDWHSGETPSPDPHR